jgi:redox-sensitive bicupin YhaK (pirin superfamily)
MSIQELIIEERSRDIGDFLVGRLLPFRKKRMVGPFIFVDHMGPTELKPGKHMDVDQHPHIGLSTLTYLLEGELIHKDSLGTVQRITPGDVNYMTAGKAITHTERTPEDMRDKTFVAHGYQIWVALPKDKEQMEPEFNHTPASALPSWKEDGADYTLIVGEGFGRKSPVPVLSHMFMVEIKTSKTIDLDIGDNLKGEIGVLLTEGTINACEHEINKGQMLVSKTNDSCKLTIHENSHVFLIGGEPFPEERFINWNFVSSSKETLQKAREDWINKRFPKVPGDDTYVPLPGKD